MIECFLIAAALFVVKWVRARGVRSPRTRMPAAALKFAALSGVGWGLIAYAVGRGIFGRHIWGGVLAAPLIGILIGQLARGVDEEPRWIQIVMSLLQLYVAAACFGAAVTLSGLILLGLPRDRALSETLFGTVWIIVWGLTFSGYALVLWPLSLLNHRLVWRADPKAQRQADSCDGLSTV
jgi:hypothetical protein